MKLLFIVSFLSLLVGCAAVDISIPEPKFKSGDKVFAIDYKGRKKPGIIIEATYDGNQYVYDIEMYMKIFGVPAVFVESVIEDKITLRLVTKKNK